jgi:hypothetical protein
MADNDNMDFAKRLKRIEKSQKKFARAKYNPKAHNLAPGTTTGSKKKSTPWTTWLRRGLFAYVMFVGVKSFLIYQMGTEAYTARMVELEERDSTGKAMAFVMGTGPLTNLFTQVFTGTEQSLNAPKEAIETLSTIDESAAPEDSAQ